MQSRVLATIVVSGLLAVSLVACTGPAPEPTPTSPPPTCTPTPTGTPVPPTPTPEVREPNYSSPSLGLSLWYPETWPYEEMGEGVAFASSSELIGTEDWDTGAAFAVMLGELEDGQIIKELVREMLEESAFEAVDATELEPVAVGDVRGVIANLEATPMGASIIIKGFVAGVEYNRRAYVFLGLAVKDDWPEFGDTLGAMLGSVRFTEPEGTFTSEDLGLKIWYPEDWILREQDDQVIFATSRDVIDSGELPAGAALLIKSSSLGDVRLVDWFKEQLEGLIFDQGGINSDMAYRTVADQQGLIVDLWGVPSGATTYVIGFAVAVAHEEWGYLILGISAEDDWSQYHPTLVEMLDSVHFLES